MRVPGLLVEMMREGRGFLGGAALIVSQALAAGTLHAQTCQPHVDHAPGSRTASFRPHTDAAQRCPVSEEIYAEVVGTWVRSLPEQAPVVPSLQLGRAVNHPWIARHLAETAARNPDWRNRIATASAREHNRFVVAALSRRDFIRRLAAPFDGTPYRVSGVSVEKVLVGATRERANDASPPDRVPSDAVIWLQLARAAPNRRLGQSHQIPRSPKRVSR